jgi:Prokaryotic homologs of the JAB domain
MWRSEFQYFAAVESTDGEAIGDVPLSVDWIPAIRWAEFEEISSERACEDEAGVMTIEPLWSRESRPYVRGFTIGRDGRDNGCVHFPLSYFETAVVDAATELVESGALIRGQRFEYKLYALSSDAAPRTPNGPGETESSARVAPVDAQPPIVARTLAALGPGVRLDRDSAPSAATGDAHGPALRVFIPQTVLDEATTLAEQAGDVETGGILVGNLCRDPETGLFSVVTAQIPAERTEATRESLRFTFETWARVDAALRLRNRTELPLGWWHSHPFFCRACPPSRRERCPFSVPTFSLADKALHREVFQTPWSVALLLSFLGGERPSYDLYGWNRGQIEAQEFSTLTGVVR